MRRAGGNEGSSEQRLAREWQRRLQDVQDLASREDARRFASELALKGRAEEVVIGRALDPAGGFFWAGVSSHKLLSHHAWILGGTGSGKTFYVLGILLQILRSGRHPVIVLDLKGELSELLLDVVLPALASGPRGARFLERLRIVRPFDARFVPELRITLPEPGIPREVQALTIAAALEDALGDDLGIRMNRVFTRLVSLAIEQNLPLTVLSRWLEEPGRFAREAQGSQDPALRRYAAGAFLREARGSVEAVAARLDVFLFLQETRLALSTPGCVSFSDCLESGVTILDLGNPPAGAERAARFWAGILIGRLMRAILSRRLTARSSQALLCLEEFQEALSVRQAEQFARLLALSRFKNVSLWFVNQQVAQLDSGLVKLLRTNTGLEAIFRSSFEDAKAISHALPVSGDPRTGRQERQALLEEIPRLADRAFYLWLKGRSFRAQLVRSPRLDLRALQARARGLSEQALVALARGSVARDRAEVEASLRQAEPARRSRRTPDLFRSAERKAPDGMLGIG